MLGVTRRRLRLGVKPAPARWVFWQSLPDNQCPTINVR